MTIENAILELRKLNEPVPIPLKLPTRLQIIEFEKNNEIFLPQDYILYLLEASDVVYGNLEPATIQDPSLYTDLTKLFKLAKQYGIPSGIIPFCEDNGDMYCITINGTVKYWSHDQNGFTKDNWSSLSEWIIQVWIGNS